MIKSAFKKIKSQSGETLVEMLVSLVIMGLSIAMLVAMILTSTRVTNSTKEMDKDFRNQLSAAEAQTAAVTSVSNSTVKIENSENPATAVDVPVEYYYSDVTDVSLKSYKLSEAAAAGT